MSIQPAATAPATARSDPGMKSRPVHTEQILRDDIRWLQGRIQQLRATDGASERRLADCYRKLLRQRQHQLASGGGPGGVSTGCWQDYLC